MGLLAGAQECGTALGESYCRLRCPSYGATDLRDQDGKGGRYEQSQACGLDEPWLLHEGVHLCGRRVWKRVEF